jgi:hypothetical protein
MTGKGKSHSKRSCIYCRSDEDMTADHIPPKALFPDPRPSNMLTVPCCKKCNESFSKDDEYFRTVLVSHASVCSDPNVRAVNDKLLRSMSRPEAAAMASAIRKSLHVVDVMSRGGIYLDKSPAMMVNADRINRVTNRIARGLFYITHDYPVPMSCEVTCVFKDAAFSVPEEFIAPWGGFWKQPVTIGENVFGYSYALCVDDPNGMLFIYWFYGSLCFYGYILPKPEVEVTRW